MTLNGFERASGFRSGLRTYKAKGFDSFFGTVKELQIMERDLNELVIRPAMRYAVFRVLHWVLLALLFLAMAWVLLPSFVLVSVLFIGIGFYKLMYVRCMVYTLTDEVLRVQAGILFKRTDHLELFRVKDFVVTESLLMQILGLMTLELLTTDLTGPVVILRGIPRSAIADVIRNRVAKGTAA